MGGWRFARHRPTAARHPPPQAVVALPAHEVVVDIIRAGVGPVTKSDVEMAHLAGATVLGFNVGLDKEGTKLARGAARGGEGGARARGC